MECRREEPPSGGGRGYSPIAISTMPNAGGCEAEFIPRPTSNVGVCPGPMVSTAEEGEFAAPCLASLHAQRILLVTSAYHTRRALAIFRQRLQQYKWSVAATEDSAAYVIDWWRRRAWAKTRLAKTERFFWWEAVDRWRCGPITR